MEADIVVIGAGPAGSTFARVAAKSGLGVIVVDKRKDVGIPVRCGEGLGEREVIKEGLDLPKQVYSTEIVGAKVVAPNGKSIVWKGKDTKGWVLERRFFDKWLAELAIDAGAKVRMYTEAYELIKENGKIAGVKIRHNEKEDEIRAKLIVSAEGMEAWLARKAGFKAVARLYDVDTCYEYEMKPYDHENLIELYFGNEIAPRGYVWIFPKASRKANVGIGIGAMLDKWKKLGGIPGAAPKPLLDRFIENHPQLRDASTLEDFGGVISVGGLLDEFVKDNFMVIGTAARQVDPIHGGGIAMAMEAGVLAASTAAKAFEKKDFSANLLREYERAWKETAGKKYEKRLRLRKVLEHISDDDLNHIIGEIGAPELDLVMKGDYAPVVAKVVAGRPQILRLLKPLITG
ncbi:MAG: NAD(P)/FAD-dependent oxidoreductase [Candidatus Anstonellales archaeon]